MSARDPGTAPPHPGAVVAVCGFSGSGKTTLLERVIPVLRRQGLAVAVVKHDVHGVDVDRRGKDSDRLFRAGADVVLQGPDEVLGRTHHDASSLAVCVDNLLTDHDLVLVEGHRGTPLPRVWLTAEDGALPPPGPGAPREVLEWDGDREGRLLAFVVAELESALKARPLCGGVLVGGAGSRLGGRPKHLLRHRGQTLLEVAIQALKPQVDRLLLLGAAPQPDPLTADNLLPDPPDARGPIAGLLAGLRWASAATWVVAACDMPHLTADAVTWLLEQRRPGRWAVLPRLSDAGVEPLLAVYEPQARTLLEEVRLSGRTAPRFIADHPHVVSPCPPGELHRAWTNINTAEDLAHLEP